MDLTIATNCIRVMKEYGTYRGHRIGIVRASPDTHVSQISGVSNYRPGEIVLFREETDESNLGEFRGVKPKPTGRLTIESPLCQAEIDKQKAQGSLITTFGIIVGVPRRYIEEIKLN